MLVMVGNLLEVEAVLEEEVLVERVMILVAVDADKLGPSSCCKEDTTLKFYSVGRS